MFDPSTAESILRTIPYNPKICVFAGCLSLPRVRAQVLGRNASKTHGVLMRVVAAAAG